MAPVKWEKRFHGVKILGLVEGDLFFYMDGTEQKIKTHSHDLLLTHPLILFGPSPCLCLTIIPQDLSRCVSRLLCPLLTSPMRSESIALFPANSPRTRRSRATWEISQGKTQNFVARKRRIYKAHPNRRWRTSWSRAHWSRVYHTSYPVPVRRPALLDWASSRPSLAAAPLPFS